jgi:hypothetical protein
VGRTPIGAGSSPSEQSVVHAWKDPHVRMLVQIVDERFGVGSVDDPNTRAGVG